MSDKILVAYATKAGSTAEVAEAVGEELRNMGAEVDVRLAQDVKALKPYSAVILGSAIRMGKWVPEATKVVEKNRRTVEGYLDPVREMVEPVDTGLFAGVIDYSKLSFTARTMSKAMKVSEGDYRDWEAIGAWARQVHSRLTRG